MKRVAIAPRPNWQAAAEQHGFVHHSVDGETYWDESAYYEFTLRQIERDIEAPTEELHAMCMDLVDEVVQSEALMERLAIPESHRDWVANSWFEGQHHVYGRFDLAYDGQSPARLLEANADTPSSLYEAAFWQWHWLHEQQLRKVLRRTDDQFNQLQECLVEAYATIAKTLPRPIYFSAVRDSAEDQATIAYLRDCAAQAGLTTGVIAIEDVGITAQGQFTDSEDIIIGTLSKLYPLEELMAERYGSALPRSGLRLIEPPWKAILSNKGILPLLWRRHTGHPNLLPAYFEDERSGPLGPGWVRKPFFSREGANIDIVTGQGETVSSGGGYGGGPAIRQAFHALPNIDGNYPLIGSWVVADRAAGMGIREDATLITQDTSRFLPHIIRD